MLVELYVNVVARSAWSYPAKKFTKICPNSSQKPPEYYQ